MHLPLRIALLLIGLLAPLSLVAPAWADWPPDGIVLPGDGNSVMLEDGAGGIYVGYADSVGAWMDRLNGEGERVPGFPVLAGTTPAGMRTQPWPRLARDGEGGVLLAWGASGDGRSESLLSRVRASGAVAWSRRLSAYRGYFWPLTGIAPGDSGDSYVAWIDSAGVRLTRVTREGIPAEGWPIDGLIAADRGSFSEVTVEADGAGGIVVAIRYNYYDDRLLIQRFGPDARRLWTWLRPAYFLSWGSPRSIPDGAGGTFFSWVSPDARRLMAQRLGADGLPAAGWPDSGLVVTGPDFWAEYSARAICGDGSGGVYLVWSDLIRDDIFAQHLDADGSPAAGWPDFGKLICGAQDHQDDAKLVPDGSGGVVIAWQDWRFRIDEDTVAPFALRLTSAGQAAPGWSGDGTMLAGSVYIDNVEAVPDGTGGAFVSWSTFVGWDARRVQRVRGDGRYGPMINAPPDLNVRLLAPFPQPFSSSIDCDVQLARAGVGAVEVFDASGRRVAILIHPQMLPAGSHRVHWDGRDLNGDLVNPGLYFLQVRAADSLGAARLVKVR